VGLAPSPILDIEELVSMGRRDHVCPYFYSREGAENADILFLPYNYLLDASIRSTLKVEWADAAVILDEAHNIEKVKFSSSQIHSKILLSLFRH
jgi:Rad3-related DNA helicase